MPAPDHPWKTEMRLNGDVQRWLAAQDRSSEAYTTYAPGHFGDGPNYSPVFDYDGAPPTGKYDTTTLITGLRLA